MNLNKKEYFLTFYNTILVFDSGVGGLSIYHEIRHLMPNLRYIYVFDNIAFPYGEKSDLFIIERVFKIVSTIQKRYQIELIVIACNTASIIALPVLRKAFHFPIVGVVPAIKPATHITKNGIIGLLATRATVQCPHTHELINHFVNKNQILILSSGELVKMAEAKLRNRIVSLKKLKSILSPWLYIKNPPDTIILGCTHFPLLKDELIKVLPKGTQLVDSGAAIARRIAYLLKNKPLDAKLAYNYNIAFCMTFNAKTKQLLPFLKNCGFKILRKL